MHEGTKRLLFLAALIAAWLVPGGLLVAVVAARLRPSYYDAWRDRLTSATGLNAGFSALEHPLPGTVRWPRLTFQDALNQDRYADCDTVVVSLRHSGQWNVRAATIRLTPQALQPLAAQLAHLRSRSAPGPATPWRIEVDRVLFVRDGKVLWCGTALLAQRTIQEGEPVFRATWLAENDDFRLPPVSLQIVVPRETTDHTAVVTTLDTAGRHLPLELCRAACGQNPQITFFSTAAFNGQMTVRRVDGLAASTPFAPDPILEETIVSGELRCVWNAVPGPTPEAATSRPPAQLRISMNRLHLQNGRAVAGSASVTQAVGIPPDAVETIFYQLLGNAPK